MDKYAEKVFQDWETRRTHINSRLEDYFNNIAFALGFHYQAWDSELYSYFVPPLEDEHQTITFADNLLQSLIDSRVAKLVGSKPVLNVVSKDKSAKSIEQAAYETDILKAIWYDRNVPSLLIQVANWAVVCNRCFVRPYWNPDQESAEIDLIDGIMVLHDDTQRNWERVRSRGWVDIKSIQSKDSLITLFPDKKKIIEGLPEVTEAGICSVQEKIMDLEDRASKESRMEQYRQKDSRMAGVETIERYHAPSSGDKDGVYAVVVRGGGTIHKDKLPKGSNGRIPIVDFTDQLGFTTMWGRSLVSRSRQMQKVYNIWYSKCIELGMIPPMYLIPKNSSITEDDLIEKAFLLVEYEGDEGKPDIVQPAPPPDAWIMILNLLRSSVEHLWGSHEVTSRSSTPGGKDMSGRGIALLQKEDVSRLASPITRWTDSLQDLGDILLGLYRENSNKKQKMYYPIAGGKTMPIMFSKSDITDKNAVYVEVGSEYSQNREATFQLITNILGLLKNLPNIAKILNDPMQFHKLLSFASEPIANTFIYKNQPLQHAEDENLIMVDPDLDIPKVKPWHVHPDHLSSHRTFMCSREFRRLEHERQEEILALHLVPHLKFWAKQLKGQLPPEYQGILPEEPGKQVFKQTDGKPTTEMTEIDRAAEASAKTGEGILPGEF